MKPLKSITLSVLLSLSVASGTLSAATLVDGGSIALGSAANISVSPGYEGFSTTTSGFEGSYSFNGPVYDYAFYENNIDNPAPSITGLQGLISNLTQTASGADNKITVWTSGDPDTDPANSAADGVRWADNATFNVDISGLSSGSIYIFNGSWQARTDWLDLSMTGSGQPDVNVTNYATSPNVSALLMNAKRIDFTDAADYDTITFTLQESGSQSGYFGGVVITNVTAVPEPSASLLIGFGCLLLLRRRRCQE